MIRERADVAVLGAGFGGSLLALVLRRLGRSVLLVERGTHPRFAIGESSTPLGNLVLESLARTYDLPRLAPLAKWGTWQRASPHLACGLKRGFTFFKHEPGRPFVPRADRANELLVAASPGDEVGDTHWFREHFDQFLMEEARAAGAAYLDRTEVRAFERVGEGWLLRGSRAGEAAELSADFVVDATGPAGPLARALGIDTSPAEVRTNAWAVYSHFVDVEWWEDVYRAAGGDLGPHPYRCDNAALHHVLADGWVWVLRFNNGVTSAGFALDGRLRRSNEALSPEAEWQAELERYPGMAEQFAKARAVQPFVRTGRLQRRAHRAAGPGWALLPHAAYFLDALFSSGNAHTSLGVEWLARAFERHWGRPTLAGELERYERALFREIDFVDRLVDGCYRCFGRFEALAAYVMYYFAGAIHAEESRRGGLDAGVGFLSSELPLLREAVERDYERLPELVADPKHLPAFEREVARTIAPINVGGLCDPAKSNLYPFVQVTPG